MVQSLCKYFFYQAVTAPYFTKDNRINNKKWGSRGGEGGEERRDRNGERFKWNTVFRFTGTLDLADGSMAEKARTGMKSMQPVCRGCIHFARVIRPSCDARKGPRLFCRGYCTSGTSYPSHRPSGILAQHFSGRRRISEKFSRSKNQSLYPIFVDFLRQTLVVNSPLDRSW